MAIRPRTAIITGGARRLGKHICLGLADAGFNIGYTYHSSPESIVESTSNELKSKGSEVYAVKCNVESFDEVNSAVGKFLDFYGGIDVLVNNAAIFKRIDFYDISQEDFLKFANTNLGSVLSFSRAVSKNMNGDKDSPSAIINISSMGAFENWTGYIPYSIAKAGVVKLTELLAKLLAPNILVNSIAPGTIIIEDDNNETVNIEEMKMYPLKRFGKTEDIVSLVRYLAVENKFITGQTIRVDGGKGLK